MDKRKKTTVQYIDDLWKLLLEIRDIYGISVSSKTKIFKIGNLEFTGDEYERMCNSVFTISKKYKNDLKYITLYDLKHKEYKSLNREFNTLQNKKNKTEEDYKRLEELSRKVDECAERDGIKRRVK